MKAKKWSRRSFIARTSSTAVLAIIGNQSLLGEGHLLDKHPDEKASVDLQSGFGLPPMDAKPRIWWFWGESVTTDQGITKDLEAYKRVGFGGVVIYEQVFGTGLDALKSLSPDWLERVRFAAAECARLDLALEFNVSSGYVAGGPWITPELGMQRLVFSETHLDGGRELVLTVRQPDTKLNYYKDVACLAYPSLPEAGNLPIPNATCNTAGIDLDSLFHRVASNTTVVNGDQGPYATNQKARIRPRADGLPIVIQLDYTQEVTLRSLTFSQRKNSKALVIATEVPGAWGPGALGQGIRRNPPVGILEASTDGQDWQEIVKLPAMGSQQDSWDRLTVSFAAVRARYFRLNFSGWGHNFSANDDDLVIGDIELSGDARVDRWESKSGNFVDFSDPDQTPRYGPDEVVVPGAIVDLTQHLKPDGTLIWDPPPGRWTILRLGHTPTGARTKHGRPETMGLECDKLSAYAAQVQFEHYLGPILAAVREIPDARIEGIGMDSAEHGSQNWTPDFLAQFKRRRGYDLLLYLPVMVGVPVDTVEATDRILFDVRRTIADLMSDEYYGTFQYLAHAEGMTLTAQAPGIATCLPSDNIQSKGRVDIPMGEFWVSEFGSAGQPEGTMDCREAASAAHLYGKKIVAAESFTGSPSSVYPGMLKPYADAAFVNGINRITVLAGNHQPYGDDQKPGVTEPRFYLPYQRNNTWWEQSSGFWNTLGRSCFMLRQGQPVVDLLYHLGSDTPLKIATWRMHPAPPNGYDYDVCDDEALLSTTIQDGHLISPGGMRYTVLVLAGGDAMTLAAARHLRDLVIKGAQVIAPVRVRRTPGFSDASDQPELRRIADELWGIEPQSARDTRRVGAGMVVWGLSPARHLAELGIVKDFHVPDLDPLDLLFTHRRLGNIDIYFIANHRPHPITVEAVFRDGQGKPQAWDPATGKQYDLKVASSSLKGSTVPLRMEMYSSLFVMFGMPSSSVNELPPLIEKLAVWETIAGPWQVSFAPKWGGPASTMLPSLTSWTLNEQDGVRHYSGTAIYSKDIDLPLIPPGPIWIDLGRVEIVATLFVNGMEVSTLWKAPFAAEISKHLRKGKNQVDIHVTNLWANRLIADAGLPADKRISWTTFNPYKPTDRLLSSGLLGPVTLRK